MKKRDTRFVMAAVAGLSMGLSAPAIGIAEEKEGSVKCWGVNGCGQHAKCSVKAEDLKAFETLLGEKEFKERFGKSAAHSCGSHASCGASSKILNWTPTTGEECKAQGGYIIEETGPAKTKVARKA